MVEDPRGKYGELGLKRSDKVEAVTVEGEGDVVPEVLFQPAA